jgi:hypothetical protein
LAFPAGRESRRGGSPDDWAATGRARNRLIRGQSLAESGFRQQGDSMPHIQTVTIRPLPSIVPSDIPAMSDQECLNRLARAVREHDSARLDEVARLIARLAVTIE